LDRPVIAAMHGTVLGGGLELALACHWRVALRQTQFGLPEVKLGLLPGSLGTQRLPRLVGPSLALELIASGRSMGAAEALAAGILDAVLEGDPQEAGLAYARDLLIRGGAPRRLSESMIDASALPADTFSQGLEKA